MTTIHIDPIPAFKDNYIWIIHDTKFAVVVDPGDAPPVMKYLRSNQLQLTAILITHHHSDHIGGNRALLEQHQIPVYGPKREAISTVTHALQDNDTVYLDALSLTLKVIEVPGHTHGHIAYFGLLPNFQKKNILLCGDTLFASGCGRIFEGTPQQMYRSLKRLEQLPDDTLVYCTHEYTLSNISFARVVEPGNAELKQQEQRVKQLRRENKPTLPSLMATEKKCNPFLRCNQPEIIKITSQHAGKKLNEPLDVFTTLREWKNNF